MAWAEFLLAVTALVAFVAVWRSLMSRWVAARMRKAGDLDEMDRAWLEAHERKHGRHKTKH